MQDRNNISIISQKYDSINIVIPSNVLKKGYIRFIKLGTFFASKSQGGGRMYPPPCNRPCLSGLNAIKKLLFKNLGHNHIRITSTKYLFRPLKNTFPQLPLVLLCATLVHVNIHINANSNTNYKFAAKVIRLRGMSAKAFRA